MQTLWHYVSKMTTCVCMCDHMWLHVRPQVIACDHMLLHMWLQVTSVTICGICDHMWHTTYRSDLYDRWIAGEVLLRFWGSTMPTCHKKGESGQKLMVHVLRYLQNRDILRKNQSYIDYFSKLRRVLWWNVYHQLLAWFTFPHIF